MPKTVRLIINMVFTFVLFLLLLGKLVNTLSHWEELVENRELYEKLPSGWTLFFVFGVYPAILFTGVSLWLRGVLPIVLSALGLAGGFVLYCFETLFAALYEAYEVDTYMGFDPFISMFTYMVAFFALAVTIAEFILAKKKKKSY